MTLIMGTWFWRIDCKGGKSCMAVRQYIGARYVPKFFENPDGSNEWLEGIAYEALTIVTYAGNSFTSKIPVPANVGSPNLNQKYWVNTGIGGGGDINELQKQVNDIQSAVDELSSKGKYIFLTDSYGTINSLQSKNIISIACEDAKIPSDQYYDSRVGGSAFNISAPVQFINNLKGLDISNKNEIKEIFVFGGANDINVNGNNISTGIKNFIDYCSANYPNAKVYIGFLSQYANNNSVDTSRVYTIYKSTTITNGAYFLDNMECIMHELSWFDTDLLHPKRNVIPDIAHLISPFIKAHKGDVTKIRNVSIVTKKEGVSASLNLTMVQNNHQVSMKVRGNGQNIATITKENSSTILDSKADVTINNTLIFGKNSKLAIFPCTLTGVKNVSPYNQYSGSGYIGVEVATSNTEVPIDFFIIASNTIQGCYVYPNGSTSIFEEINTHD